VYYDIFEDVFISHQEPEFGIKILSEQFVHIMNKEQERFKYMGKIAKNFIIKK
jgi:hypothetical protein